MPFVVGDNTKISAAQAAALNGAREYLKKQLLNPSPLGTIYSTVKNYIESNTHLNAMMTTRLTLVSAYGWNSASLLNPSNDAAGNENRKRYLECVGFILAVLA